MAEAVKVAVRCRPFNGREKERNATLIIDMIGNTTKITDPASGKHKEYTFDYSYWSHDGFHEREDGYLEADKGSKYADQQQVMNDLGMGVLENAWNGFHSCVFAYGQTGSGKSYSIVGYGTNKGVIPQTCAEMFRRTDAEGSDERRFEVEASMMEIYNEKMRDLLNPKMSDKLKIRETKQLGVYVESLTTVAVKSYKEIEHQMEVGTAHRTIGSTNMNATSSRAHTVFAITFKQFTRQGTAWGETKSVINLVDLAGSERAESTGATGDRLKEGAAINSSLTALGQVITALAENSGNSKKKTFVPFRNSVLTRLLQSALGGNSKTVMVAALSPADINYDETLSTLRYADNAKKIKTAAVKNEDPTAKMIRELKEENEKLKKMLEGQGGDLSALAGSGLQNEQLEAAQAAAAAAEQEAKAAKEAMLAARAEVEAAQQQMSEFQHKMKLLESESGWSDELNALRNELASKDSYIDQLKQAGDAEAVVAAQQANAKEVERLQQELAAAQSSATSATAAFIKDEAKAAVNQSALYVLESSGATNEVEQRRAARDELARQLQRAGSTVDEAQVQAVMDKMGTASSLAAIGEGAAADLLAIQQQISADAEKSVSAAKAAEKALEKLAASNAEIRELQEQEAASFEARSAAEEARIQAAVEKATVDVLSKVEEKAGSGQATAADEAALRAELLAQLEAEMKEKKDSAVMQAAVSRSVGKLIGAAHASSAGDAAAKAEIAKVRTQMQGEADMAFKQAKELASVADRHAREAGKQRAALEDKAQQVAALKKELAESTAAKDAAHAALTQSRIDRAALRLSQQIESGELSSATPTADLRRRLITEVHDAGVGAAPIDMDSSAAQAMLDANVMRLEAACQKAKVSESSRAQVESMRDTLRAEVLEAHAATKKAKEEADARLAELQKAKSEADSRNAELESLRIELQSVGKNATSTKVASAFSGAQLQAEKQRLRAKLAAEMEAAQAKVATAQQSEQSNAVASKAAEQAERAAAESARIAREELAAAQALAQEQAEQLKELQNKSAAEREQLLKELEAKSQEAAQQGDVSKKLDFQRQMKRISDRNKLESEMKAKAREQLEANEKMVAELGKSWEEKLKQAEELESGRKELLTKMGLHGLGEEGIDEKTPHLVNLHEDPLMSGQLIHFLKPGVTLVGSKEDAGVVLNGVSIEAEHCKLTNEAGAVHIEPLGKAVTFVNGKRLESRRPLEHSARVIIGQNAIFRFADPTEAEKQRAASGGKAKDAFSGVIDWDMAQKELHEALQSSVQLKVDEEVERERKAMESRLKEMEEKLARERAASEAAANAEKEAILQQLREREKAMEELREKQFEAEKNAVRNEARAQALEEERDRNKGNAAPGGPNAGAVGTMGLGVQRPKAGGGMLGAVRPGTAGGAAPPAGGALDPSAELLQIKAQYAAVDKSHTARIDAIQMAHRESMDEVDKSRSSMDQGLGQYKLDLQRIEDELRTAHPAVVEANAIADAMGRKVEVRTHIRIETPEVMGLSPIQELLQVRRAHLEYQLVIHGDQKGKQRVTTWAADEFWRRVDRFRDAHAYYLKHNRQPFETRDEDPFYAPPAAETLGKAVLFLKPLAHRMRLQTWAPIFDPSGAKMGELQLAFQPTELDFVSATRPVLNPSDAVGQASAAILRIQQARGLPPHHCTNVFVKYSADGMEERSTAIVSGKNATPRFDHRDHLAFGEMSPALISFLTRDALTLEVVAEPDDIEEGLVTEAPKTAASAAGANPYDGGELPPEVFDFNIAVDLLEGTADADASNFERCRFDGGSNALGVPSGIFTLTHQRPRRILLQCVQGTTQAYPIKHVVSAWIGRVQDPYGNEVEPQQVPLQVLSMSTTADGRTTNIVANWFRGPPLLDQLSPEGTVFFPTVTLEVELRNLDLAAPIALTKMFALRVEDTKPVQRNKSYFFSRNASSSKRGGGSAAATPGGPVNDKMQFDDEHAKQRLQHTSTIQQVKMGSLERSDDAVAKQREEMKRLLEKETQVTAAEGKKKLLGDASKTIETLQKALQAEEQRQDSELQRAMLALRQMGGGV